MQNQETLYQVTDRVATITLNRPDKLNAWTAVMEQEVRAPWTRRKRTQRSRHCVDRRGAWILRRRGHVAVESHCGARHRRARELSQISGRRAKRSHARGFSEEIFVFPIVQKPVIAAHQRSGGRVRVHDYFVLRSAIGFGCGAFRDGVCPARVDCGVRNGVDVAAAGRATRMRWICYSARV